jgi:hypothetical protein
VATRDKQVFPSVVVEVIESRAKARHLHAQVAHSTRRGHFTKIAFARVLKKRKGLVIKRHEGQIGVTIVIEVAEVQSHARDKLSAFGKCHTCVERDLLEPIPEVVKQEVVLGVVCDK